MVSTPCGIRRGAFSFVPYSGSGMRTTCTLQCAFAVTADATERQFQQRARGAQRLDHVQRQSGLGHVQGLDPVPQAHHMLEVDARLVGRRRDSLAAHDGNADQPEFGTVRQRRAQSMACRAAAFM